MPAETLYFNGMGQFEMLGSLEREQALSRAITSGRNAWNVAVAEGRSLTEAETQLFTDGLEARQTFIEANLRLAVSATRRYWSRALPDDKLDIIQEGNRGLQHAVEMYDPDKGFKFSTYASWWIKQYAQRYVAANKSGSVSARTVEEIQALTNYEELYEEKHGKSADNDQKILEETGWSKKKLKELRQARFLSAYTTSLDQPLTSEDGSLSRYDLIVDEGANFDDATTDAAETLKKILHLVREFLSPEEYQIYIRSVEKAAGFPTEETMSDDSPTKAQTSRLRKTVSAFLIHPINGSLVNEDASLDWRIDANCLGAPAEVFFMRRGESSKRAEKYCDIGACPVKEQCTKFAIDNNIKHGWWGGSERSRRQKRPATPTVEEE